jgi:hypothetical protein
MSRYERNSSFDLDESSDEEVDMSQLNAKEKKAHREAIKVKKMGREKQKRAIVNGQFDHLSDMLGLGRVEKLAVLESCIGEITDLLAANADLREQRQLVHDALRKVTGKVIKSKVGKVTKARKGNKASEGSTVSGVGRQTKGRRVKRESDQDMGVPMESVSKKYHRQQQQPPDKQQQYHPPQQPQRHLHLFLKQEEENDIFVMDDDEDDTQFVTSPKNALREARPQKPTHRRVKSNANMLYDTVPHTTHSHIPAHYLARHLNSVGCFANTLFHD